MATSVDRPEGSGTAAQAAAVSVEVRLSIFSFPILKPPLSQYNF